MAPVWARPARLLHPGAYDPAVKRNPSVGTGDVAEVYDGDQGRLYELVFGESIHVGGREASAELADAAGIRPASHGVDLCCGNGAAMRFLVAERGVAEMTGVDISEALIDRGERLVEDAGLSEQIRFVAADATRTDLADARSDFVWSEDAWVYVPDKAAVVAEAARIVRPGGTIAFTDWVEGPAGLADDEAVPLLEALTFPGLLDIEGYRSLLESNGCDVRLAADTGRFGGFMDECADRLRGQVADEALALVGSDPEALELAVTAFADLAQLGHAAKLAQARFVATRR